MTPLESSWNDFLVQFGRITIATMIIPIIVAAIYKKHWNRPFWVVFIFCSLTFGINLFEQSFIWASNKYYDILRPFFEYWEISDTIFLSILYYLKDLLLIGWFYKLISPLIPYNKYILWISRILALACSINYFLIEGYNVFGIFNPLADALFVVTLSFLYLWISQRQSLRIPLKKNPYLWISLGFLCPNLLSLFLYFTGDYIYRSDFILYAKFFSIRNLFEIIGQILIAIGFIHARYARFITIPDQEATKIGS